MELTERVESINQQLMDLFGIDTITGLPIWRVVFSEDQLEKRFGTYDDYTPAGLFIRTVTEVREVPKYRQWIKAKYVLERLTVIPEINLADLPTSRLSYEPIYVFEDVHSNALPPKITAAKFIIDALYASMGKSSLAKYKDPDSDPEEAKANYQARIDKLQEELFGNESDIGDALAHNEAVTVPQNYVKEN